MIFILVIWKNKKVKDSQQTVDENALLIDEEKKEEIKGDDNEN